MQSLRTLAALAIIALVAVLLIWWLVDAFGVRNPLFAFLANWVAMSAVAFGGQFIHISFPPQYYIPTAFERSGRVYELVGIRLFKALVRRGPLAIFSPTLRFPKEKSAASLRQLEGQMRKAEAGHAIIFLLVLVGAGYSLVRGWPDAAAWLVLFSIPINGYPIMLQRYNRIKLEEAIHALEVAPTTQA